MSHDEMIRVVKLKHVRNVFTISYCCYHVSDVCELHCVSLDIVSRWWNKFSGISISIGRTEIPTVESKIRRVVENL